MFGRRAALPAAGVAGRAAGCVCPWAWANCGPPAAAAAIAAPPPSSMSRRERPVLIACRLLSACGLVAEHATEADMAHAGVHHLGVPRRRPVAAAIARR